MIFTQLSQFEFDGTFFSFNSSLNASIASFLSLNSNFGVSGLGIEFGSSMSGSKFNESKL